MPDSMMCKCVTRLRRQSGSAVVADSSCAHMELVVVAVESLAYGEIQLC